MPAERFLDTNIILYAYDTEAGEKRDIAQCLLKEALLNPAQYAISVQVLQEFHVNFIRKGNTLNDSITLIDDLSHLSIIENTTSLFRTGLRLQSRWQLSLWDSMILAAAKASGAQELVTEDLNHGQNYDGIRAWNPFI